MKSVQMIRSMFGGPRPQFARTRGFTLIELLVAMTLGLLLSAGIITLFGSTNRTNRVQNALARLQENGRYAMGRITDDLRMLNGQFCSNSQGLTGAGAALPTTVIPQGPRYPRVYGPMTLPDMTGSLPGAPFNLDTRLFVQGYECGGAGCTPALPAALPSEGTGNGQRVRGSDVLTVRYQTGSGWPVTSANCIAGGAITVANLPGDDWEPTAPTTFATNSRFRNGDLALISNCQSPTVVPVNAANGSPVTVAASVTGSPTCPSSMSTDTRLFNFTRDFQTVTYYLGVKTDPSPDGAGRMIPVLLRRVNGAAAQELVEGVERLDFIYGVDLGAGSSAFMTATQINASGAATVGCQPRPDGLPNEAGCLWRSVKSVEAHMLLNTVNNIGDISGPDTAFRYSIDGSTIAQPPATLPSGLAAGKMMRREFVGLIAVRNND